MDIIAKAARPLARKVHQERGAPLTVTMSINEAARENPSQRVSLHESSAR
jgi:ribosomal protein L39E